ncbi:MAG: hypothetical protein L0I76_31915 [Pseudonocardia sp.]|nr:hypothetical protein [Pseudonocardia sp.]
MVPEPELPDSVTPADLDTDVRGDLRGLQKETAEKVARHLVAAGLLVDEEPQRALAHARYARRRASRIAVVREAAGIVAYHAGEWNEALGEFRAARRMGGGPGHVPVMADIERALGRPERALELTRGPEVRDLGEDERIELLIVAAGARRDLGELEAAVVGLQVAELEPSRRDPWSGRLFYAYADNLLAVGRRAEAVQWFVHAHDADTGEETDAADRIAELTGDELPGSGDDGLTLGMEDTPVSATVEVVDAGDTVTDDTDDDAVTGDSGDGVVTDETGDDAADVPDADTVDADAVDADAADVVDADAVDGLDTDTLEADEVEAGTRVAVAVEPATPTGDVRPVGVVGAAAEPEGAPSEDVTASGGDAVADVPDVEPEETAVEDEVAAPEETAAAAPAAAPTVAAPPIPTDDDTDADGTADRISDDTTGTEEQDGTQR